MNQAYRNFKKYLLENRPNYGDPDIQSLMEFLRESYTIYNPVDNERIKERFLSLEPVMDVLTREQEEALFSTISELCTEYEKEAFLSGIQVGAGLAMELFCSS